MIFKLLTFLCFSFFSLSSAFALVDYGESSSFVPNKKERANKKSSRMVKRRPKSASSPTKRGGPSGFFDISTVYNVQNVGREFGDGKINQYNINTHFQTGYNIFVDASFWMASSEDENLSSEKGTQMGNPLFKIGFNWLRFGNSSEMATINLVGGMSFKNSGSTFASSRSDQLYAVETTKRFHDFALGLSYEIRVTGASNSDSEMDLGNMKSFLASIGWKASPDISFVVEGATTKISPSKSTEKKLFLEDEITFGYVSPKLILGISPLIKVEMGALFRTKRVTNKDNLVDAKMWDLKGVYGNTLFTGLNISI
jgi:hypothetical protein